MEIYQEIYTKYIKHIMIYEQNLKFNSLSHYHNDFLHEIFTGYEHWII